MNTGGDFERPRHPIQVVARRTGLTPDVLRAWERRYDAVVPARTDTQRRLYSDADIERLVMLKRATAAGRSISQVAALSAEELAAVIQEDESLTETTAVAVEPSGDRAWQAVAEALDAVAGLDSARLRGVLASASMALPETTFIEQVLAPLMQQVGDRWKSGELRIVHEHLATATVRWYVGELTRRTPPHGAKTAVVATPSGQRHEVGAMLAAATATSAGWRVLYLGADLPAEEIAAAVRKARADCVALSIVYPTHDPLLAGELTTLSRLVPQGVVLIAGGRGVADCADLLGGAGARIATDLEDFRRILNEIG